jgi:hypothetical protein
MRREIEIVLAVVVIIAGIRTGLPLTSPLTPGPYGTVQVISRAVFGLLVLTPGVMLLLWPKVLHLRQKALLGAAASNLYVGAAVLFDDWTRLASGGEALGWVFAAFILYAGARAEGRKHDD